MFFNQSDLDKEIRELHLALDEKRKAFDKGMKANMSFDDLRTLYEEIKALSKRQELLFDESDLQKHWGPDVLLSIYLSIYRPLIQQPCVSQVAVLFLHQSNFLTLLGLSVCV